MTTADLIRRAEARWEGIRTAQPDLEPAIQLQRGLITRVLEAIDALAHRGDPPEPSLTPQQVASKLGQGVPALRGETIPLPMALLDPLAVLARLECVRMCRFLVTKRSRVLVLMPLDGLRRSFVTP